MVARDESRAVNHSFLFTLCRALRFNPPGFAKLCVGMGTMIRSVWLAFAFLVCLGALAAWKVSGATPPAQQVAEAAAEAESVWGVLPKGDRLDNAEPKLVQAVAVTPPVAEPPPQEKPIRIASRHWRDSHATLKKRKQVREQVTQRRGSHKKLRYAKR
jgi:hypothetical protein